MSISRRVAAAVTLVALATPAAAAAAQPEPAATDQITQVVAIGETFWHDRNVQPCPTPQTVITTSPGDEQEADAATTLGGCTIWIRTSLYREATREHSRPGTGGDSYRELLCTAVVHELGHTAGLEHTPTGVMSPVSETPYACKQWVRAMDRERAKQARMLRRHRPMTCRSRYSRSARP